MLSVLSLSPLDVSVTDPRKTPGLAERTTWRDSRAERQGSSVVALKRGEHALSATAPPQLRTVFLTVRFTGRVGNLLFGWAALVGLAARLSALLPTRPVATKLSSDKAVPAKQLFDQFPLASVTPLDERWMEAWSAELMRGTACKLTLSEARSNALDCELTRRLETWVGAPPPNCTIGLVTLAGFFQSFRYFEAVAEASLHPVLALAAPDTQRASDGVLASVRSALPASGVPWRLVGVQVRVGDKTTGHYATLFEQIGWEYYREGMRRLTNAFGGASSAQVAFIITAGGSMGSNAKDVETVKQRFAPLVGQEHVFFTNATDPYVDLAVLRACDGLVIGSSSLGWWAAYLARLPPGRVVAPKRIFNRNLRASHKLVRGFVEEDYYPRGWILLDHAGNASTVEPSHEASARRGSCAPPSR